MRKYLHNITLRHWDPDMRILGAKALSALVNAGTDHDLDTAIDTEVSLLTKVQPIRSLIASDSYALFSRPWQHTWRAPGFVRVGFDPGRFG